MATEIYLTQIFYPFFFGSKEISLTILFSVVQPRRTSKKEKKKKKNLISTTSPCTRKSTLPVHCLYYISKGTTSPKKSSIQKIKIQAIIFKGK
jgi:hypothetical protein